MTPAKQAAREFLRRHGWQFAPNGPIVRGLVTDDEARRLYLDLAAAIEQAVIAERSEGQIRLANAVARVDKKARQEAQEEAVRMERARLTPLWEERVRMARREEREFFVKIISRPAVWDMLHSHETAAIRARERQG